MDPVANIARQRELAAEILEIAAHSEGETWEETDPADLNRAVCAGNDLAELVQALDEWRLKGGYDPYR